MARRMSNYFDNLKVTMTRGSIFGLVDMSKLFIVETDVSNFALGGVLTQEGHPIAYESHKLNSAERRYTVSEKEMLVVVHYLRALRQYLLRSPFVVKSDNIVISHFFSQPKLTSKQARWQEFFGWIRLQIQAQKKEPSIKLLMLLVVKASIRSSAC